VARALEQNATLHTLSLKWNSLGEATNKSIKAAWGKAAGRKASDLTL